MHKKMITKATLSRDSASCITIHYNRKFTSDPSQVTNFHNGSTSHNPLPSSAEVKNEWSYTSTPPTFENDMDKKTSYLLLSI